MPSGAVMSGSLRHHVAHERRRLLERRDEAHVAVGDDADELAVALDTGRPETRNWPHSASTSATVASGVVVTGFVIMPDSLRFTLST